MLKESRVRNEMGGKLRKYKILASAYLSISIAVGSFGAYCAIPTTVANNGDSSEKILQLLETSVDDETDITENTTTIDVPGNKVSFAQSSSDDVNPNTDGLFTWKEETQTQSTPQPVTPSPTVKQQDQQPVADPFEMKDPFEMDSSKCQSLNKLKSQDQLRKYLSLHKLNQNNSHKSLHRLNQNNNPKSLHRLNQNNSHKPQHKLNQNRQLPQHIKDLLK